MTRIRIIHHTEYHYSTPVTFGPHRAMRRPLEGHNLRILDAKVRIEPAATVRWLRDIDSNDVAVITFTEPLASLLLHTEVDVDLNPNRSTQCHIDPTARTVPFQYAPDEQIAIQNCELLEQRAATIAPAVQKLTPVMA